MDDRHSKQDYLEQDGQKNDSGSPSKRAGYFVILRAVPVGSDSKIYDSIVEEVVILRRSLAKRFNHAFGIEYAFVVMDADSANGQRKSDD